MKKLISIIFIFLPIFAFAQSEYQLLEPIPCIANSGQVCGPDGMTKTINATNYIAYVYNFSIAFAAVAAVLVIVYSGFEYATSNSESGKSDAKKRIENALWGLLTILASYLILQTVDPRLVDVSITLEPIGIKGKTFNYDDLVNTALDYQIKKDLDVAKNQSQTLINESTKLRAQAEELRNRILIASSPEEAKRIQDQVDSLTNKANELESQANLTTSKASLKAVSDMSEPLVDSLQGFDKTFITDEQKGSIEERKASIKGQAEQAIKKMSAKNDLEGIKVIEADRDYYLAKIDQDIFLKQRENLMENTAQYVKDRNGTSAGEVLAGPILTYIKDYISDSINGTPEQIFDNNRNAAIEKIQQYPIPENISAEKKALLEKDKLDTIEKIKAIPGPTP